ncbi:MAG: pseudouridine synthase [Arenimonas sp.]|uniref:pseudouridine synthase n=1 Tax=Arenimonas sp. TaxID=1872635 RepID=UPI0025B86ABA|nr:pseudouridine synthase [Arenimonas sp.]MBW8367993.1 pseudouridine synthase [Arenimonas sp.]
MNADPIASRLQLPPGPWATVLEALCAHFPRMDPAQWRARMAAGRVMDATGATLALDTPYRVGLEVQYFREVAGEIPLPFDERVLHADAHLVVADKPPFLPVTPSGQYLEHTLLRRLVRRLDNPGLVPLHRIDRATSGLVLFSANPASRGAYQALFRDRRIHKTYLALAAPLPALSLPHVRRSRIVAGEPFFRMREAEGEPNSQTQLALDAMLEDHWRYRLTPVTGRKHQLRVHMAALGAPIQNDPLYPDWSGTAADDPLRPLKLLAHRLEFDDPLSGERRYFESLQSL